jgi:hypothetical protein
MYYISTTVPGPEFAAFDWDDENMDKIAQRVDPEEIDAMLDDDFVWLRNSKARSGDYILVGRGKSGTPWAVSVVRTGVEWV